MQARLSWCTHIRRGRDRLDIVSAWRFCRLGSAREVEWLIRWLLGLCGSSRNRVTRSLPRPHIRLYQGAHLLNQGLCSLQTRFYLRQVSYPVSLSPRQRERTDPTYLRVNGVRACFSYRQCLRYLTHRLHVGRDPLQRAFLLRHSLQAWSDKPMKVASCGGSTSPNAVETEALGRAGSAPAIKSAESDSIATNFHLDGEFERFQLIDEMERYLGLSLHEAVVRRDVGTWSNPGRGLPRRRVA